MSIESRAVMALCSVIALLRNTGNFRTGAVERDDPCIDSDAFERATAAIGYTESNHAMTIAASSMDAVIPERNDHGTDSLFSSLPAAVDCSDDPLLIGPVSEISTVKDGVVTRHTYVDCTSANLGYVYFELTDRIRHQDTKRELQSLKWFDDSDEGRANLMLLIQTVARAKLDAAAEDVSASFEIAAYVA